MRKPIQFTALLAAAFSFAATAYGASFVVPADRDLVRRADVIVVASALTSYTQSTPHGAIETVTPVAVEEVIAGGTLPDVLNIVEPGGRLGDVMTIVPGSPQFTEGERVLLLLRKTGNERWSVAELALGKFTFTPDMAGGDLLLRDEDEIAGWDPDLRVHVERHRAAAPFLRFVRDTARGAASAEDYFVSAEPLRVRPRATTTARAAVTAGFTATSYSMTVSGNLGSRWTVFPGAVTFFTGTTTEPGAPGGGTTAVTTGLAAWTNDCGSNVNYVYGGTDSTHTRGLAGSDGANTVLFERDLSAYGVSPFTCSSSGYSGTLGIGGVTSASGSNSVNGEAFVTTNEGDVEMNRGLANCTLLFNSGDFNSAVAHELGHTLGFRHSDQNRASSAACSTDPTLECSNQAIMRSFVVSGVNATLQPWDINAVRAVYPGGSCSTCTPVSITAQPQSQTISSGSSTTFTVGVAGTAPFSYQWFVGASGNTSTPISGATGPTIVVSSAGNYWVRVTNACGTANSATATLTVTTTPPPPRRYTHGDYNGDGRADFTVWRPSNGMWYIQGVGNVQWGTSGDIPVPGDYDGDGKADEAVYRPSNGFWFIRYSSNGSTPSTQFGSSGDIPVPADYDGDGKTDIAIYRPSTGVWYYIYSGGGGGSTQFGSPGDQPVPADYNGDRRADFAVYRPSNGTWFILGVAMVQWGSSGDIPVPADYDGDGKTDVAVYRPSTGFWFFVYSSNGTTPAVQFGSVGDKPVPADYDGDGRADVAVYRPSSGVWYYQFARGGGGSTQWGSPGDMPQNQ